MTPIASIVTTTSPAPAAASSRRDLLRRAGLAAGAVAVGGVLGPAARVMPGLAKDGDALVATGELVDQLDAAGSLDHATGIVQLDLGALEKIAHGALPEDEAAQAVAAFARHAELGFAVSGSPDDVARGVGVCLPWSTVEYLVGDGRRVLPTEAQVAILADLGLFDPRRGRLLADTPEEVVEILGERFPNVAAELTPGYVGRVDVRGFLPKDVGGWAEVLIGIGKVIADAFKLPPKPNRKGIVACLRSSMVATYWWGVRVCFDPDCTREVIDYLRAGAKALSSGEVIAAIVGLGLSWYVGAIVAAAIIVHVVSGYLVADALEAALRVTPSRGACVDLSWWLWAFGVPFSGARPNV